MLLRCVCFACATGPYRRKGTRPNGTAEYRKVDAETGNDARDPEVNIYCNDGGWRIIGSQNYYQTFGGAQGPVPPENGWQEYHCAAPFPTLTFCTEAAAAGRPAGEGAPTAQAASASDGDGDGDESDMDDSDGAVTPAPSAKDDGIELLMRLYGQRSSTLLCMSRREDAVVALLSALSLWETLEEPNEDQTEELLSILSRLCALHATPAAGGDGDTPSQPAEMMDGWRKRLEEHQVEWEEAVRVGQKNLEYLAVIAEYYTKVQSAPEQAIPAEWAAAGSWMASSCGDRTIYADMEQHIFSRSPPEGVTVLNGEELLRVQGKSPTFDALWELTELMEAWPADRKAPSAEAQVQIIHTRCQPLVADALLGLPLTALFCIVDAQLAVVRALWSLVVNDDVNKDTTTVLGGIEALAGTMRAHQGREDPACIDLQASSCMVMWCVLAQAHLSSYGSLGAAV